MLVNPGGAPVEVTLHVLAPDGVTAPADVSVTVPAKSTVQAPPGLLASAPGASVVVTSQGGGILAMGDAASLLPRGCHRLRAVDGRPGPQLRRPLTRRVPAPPLPPGAFVSTPT